MKPWSYLIPIKRDLLLYRFNFVFLIHPSLLRLSLSSRHIYIYIQITYSFICLLLLNCSSWTFRIVTLEPQDNHRRERLPYSILTGLYLKGGSNE